jgi:hypothetical protein
MPTISEDEIRERAHRIWMEEGCPHGRDVENWEQARRELEQEAGNGSSEGADLDKALADTFPASDPISFTPVAGVGRPEDDDVEAEEAKVVEARFAGTR